MIASIPEIEGGVTLNCRLEARGKFLFAGDKKVRVCGVTYGTFRADSSGEEYSASAAASDFREMVARGVNAIRTYTVPPIWLLDLAHEHGLRAMVGIPWEQHITFLDDATRRVSIEERVRAAASKCAGHAAVMCYAVGNEIPASIVRWYGRKRVEKFLERLCNIVKAADPGALVTYVNFPTTEYLDLPFLDLVCFNVYLESQEPWERYLARLQNLAGERPLLLAEIGLDSRRNGEAQQAYTLDWLLRGAHAAGCAGTFVFGWTDEWHRGGFDIEDWDFGVTRRDRTPKAALDSIEHVFRGDLLPPGGKWPRISVIVCTYNGHRTIGDTLRELGQLRYPDFEVIVVDDGSSPPMHPLIRGYGFRTVRTPNQGLSAARNLGLRNATGEIVAYIDDDAYPDPDWLTFLALAFLKSACVGIGGPNLAPPGDGWIADWCGRPDDRSRRPASRGRASESL